MFIMVIDRPLYVNKLTEHKLNQHQTDSITPATPTTRTTHSSYIFVKSKEPVTDKNYDNLNKFSDLSHTNIAEVEEKDVRKI